MLNETRREIMTHWNKSQIVDCCKYIITHIDEIYGDGGDSGLSLIIKCFPNALVELNMIHRRISVNCKPDTETFKPFDDCVDYEIAKQAVFEVYEKLQKDKEANK